jgi:hypothetical protein
MTRRAEYGDLVYSESERMVGVVRISEGPDMWAAVGDRICHYVLEENEYKRCYLKADLSLHEDTALLLLDD